MARMVAVVARLNGSSGCSVSVMNLAYPLRRFSG